MIKIIAVTDTCKNNISDLFDLPESVAQKNGLKEESFKKQLLLLEKKLTSNMKKFASKYGDHISLLNIFDAFCGECQKNNNDHNKMTNWANSNSLKLSVLNKIQNNYSNFKRQVWGIFNKLELEKYVGWVEKYDIVKNMDVDKRIIFSLIMGLRLNSAVQISDDNSFKTQHSVCKNIKINKMSFCLLQNKIPKNVVYNELFIMMGKNELNIVSSIPKKIKKMLS